MKSRNIIFLILIFILAISSVSAEDVNETDVNPPDSLEEVEEEPVNVNATGSFIEGTGYVVEVTAENQFSTSKNVWCVVAAYGENNALIDAKIADFGTMASKTPDTKEGVILEKATSDNTQKVWIFVWDGYGTMVPYSKPVHIYPEAQ